MGAFLSRQTGRAAGKGRDQDPVWSRQFSSKANMPKERAAFYQSDQWKKVLHPELKQKGLIEKVEIVYTVRPSK
jgi:hypothetical protein